MSNRNEDSLFIDAHGNSVSQQSHFENHQQSQQTNFQQYNPESNFAQGNADIQYQQSLVKANKRANSALICALIGIFVCTPIEVYALIAGILALKGGTTKRGEAIAAVVISTILLIIWIIGITIAFSSGYFNNFNYSMNNHISSGGKFA